MPLPEWLTEPAPIAPEAQKGRRSWLTQAIDRLASLATPRRQREGIVRVDPRAAILGFVALIVCATFLRSISGLAVCWCVSVVLASVAGSSPRVLAAASAAAGLLTAVLTLPAATASISPGEQVVQIAGIIFTAPGLHALAVVVLRSLACLTFGLGLFASNRPEELFSALRSFRAPGVFVAVLLVTYRYLHMIARAALEVHVARKSRVPEEANLASARRWLGERIGALFARSRKLGEEVHLAMIARGFDGEWIPRPGSSVGLKDICWTCACLLLCAILLFV